MISNNKVIIILIIIILIIWFKVIIKGNEIEGFINSSKSNNNVSKEIKDLENRINDINDRISNIPIIRGPPGPEGPRGSIGLQGNPGGEYSFKGSLVNEKYPNKVLDRMSNVGISSKAFLGDNVLASNQEWYLDSKNNQIINMFDNTQCLVYDDNDRIFMGNCSDNQTKQWFYDYRTHTMRLFNDRSKCMTAIDPSSYNNLMPSIDKNGNITKDTNYNNISLVNISSCSPDDLNKRWYPMDLITNYLFQQKK